MIVYENGSIVVDSWAIPADNDKINETGDRAFINEENLFTVRAIARSILYDMPGTLAMIMSEKNYSEVEAFMYLVGPIARYYSTPQLNYEMLRDAMVMVKGEQFYDIMRKI